jgi:hypothetical protein
MHGSTASALGAWCGGAQQELCAVQVERMQAMQAAESSAQQQAAERLQQAEAAAERLKRAAAMLRQEAQGTAADNLALVKQLQHLRDERDSAQQQCQQLQVGLLYAAVPGDHTCTHEAAGCQLQRGACCVAMCCGAGVSWDL